MQYVLMIDSRHFSVQEKPLASPLFIVALSDVEGYR